LIWQPVVHGLNIRSETYTHVENDLTTGQWILEQTTVCARYVRLQSQCTTRHRVEILAPAGEMNERPSSAMTTIDRASVCEVPAVRIEFETESPPPDKQAELRHGDILASYALFDLPLPRSWQRTFVVRRVSSLHSQTTFYAIRMRLNVVLHFIQRYRAEQWRRPALHRRE
jgi:hypothetical protein